MKRIFIDADKCDGCMNCTLACMNAHRKDGADDIYTLDLNDAESESRCFILLGADKSYSLSSAATATSRCASRAA